MGRTKQRNGTGKETANPGVEHRFEEEIAATPTPAPKTDTEKAEAPAPTPYRNGKGGPHPSRLVLAMFCYENPDSPVGRHVAKVAATLAHRQVDVHLFTRRPFELAVPGIHDHAVGEPTDAAILDQVEEFTGRACTAFLGHFPDLAPPVALLGCEWSAVPALELLRADRKCDFLLSLSSLERQRSDMSGAVSKRIEDIETNGLRQAGQVLAQQPGVAELARLLLPECAGRLSVARQPFPVQQFDGKLDPGVVKARFQIGPIDPTVLFIGDMDERHGPDVLMKSVPALLRNHRQLRFVFVGDGAQWWPLRVHSRYLLLEHAVRLVGHLEGQPLQELIQAADVVVVPSREQTEWWPIQAAWAARRPVVASHPVGSALIEHERDGVLIYPHESSCVWGIERLLFDGELMNRAASRGHDKLEERFGWNSVAQQLEELLGVPQNVS